MYEQHHISPSIVLSIRTLPDVIMLANVKSQQSMNSINLPDVLTMKQACAILNCHPNTLRNWDNQGKLRSIRFGSRRDRRFKKEDIMRLVQYGK